MRIAYVCADRGVEPAGFSGSSTHVREMVRAMVARGMDVTVMAGAAEGAAEVLGCPVVDLVSDPAVSELRSRIARAAQALGDTSHSPREVRSLLLNQSLTDALERMSPPPDVVYERHSLWSVAAADFCRRRGIPHLLEVNAPLVDQQRAHRDLDLVPAAVAIEEFVIGRADRVLVTSPELIGYARAHGASRRAIRVVPCGVPASSFQAARKRAVQSAAPAHFTVGFLGSLKPWHGLDVLLRAMRKLHVVDRSYRLLVVGDGPIREEVERNIREYRLLGFSELTGNVSPADVPRELARMDVGVAPYASTSSFYFSPLKVWEYAAAGVPILASAVGDLPGLFPHGEAALLHPPGNANKLVAHVMRLRESPELAARLARRARRIARRHTWDRLAARVERIAVDAVRRG